MCTGVEYVSHEDYYNPKRTAAPVRTSGDGDGGTVGNGYSNKPLNATGIGTNRFGKNGNTYKTRNDGKKTFESGSTITDVAPKTSLSTGLGFGGKGPDTGKYSGGLY